MHIVLHSCAQFATRTYAHVECEIVLDEIGSISKCQASFLVSRLAASPLVLSLPSKAHICARRFADVLVPPFFRIPSNENWTGGQTPFSYVRRPLLRGVASTCSRQQRKQRRCHRVPRRFRNTSRGRLTAELSEHLRKHSRRPERKLLL